MRITRTGIAVACGAIALVVAARAFGLVELFVMGIAVAALLVVTGGWVRFRRVDVAVDRVIRPRRVHAGDPATAEILVHNRVRTSPVLHVHDPVSGTRGADLIVAPQHPRGTAKAVYRLPTFRRGVVEVGPMTVTLTDPFGLWKATSTVAGNDEATVLPAVFDIAPMARTTGPDPDAGTHRGAIGGRGDEFAALRSYVVGDDLRRVHWPSSARTDDDLLVREDDVPWHGRIVVVLDLRRHVHDEVVLEKAISGAASIVRAHLRRGDHVRLLTTGGFDSGYSTGGSHLTRVLDRLAAAEMGPVGALDPTIDAACHGGSGAMVLVSGRPTPEDVAVLDGAAAVPSRRIVGFADGVSRVTAHGTVIVNASGSVSFEVAWSTAESGLRSRRGAAATRR